jgi:Uma2 family endonuclease
MSYDEYLRHEQASSVRHEYVDGVVYAMSGGTNAHQTIGLNVAVLLRQRTRGTGCRTYAQIFKLRTPRGNEYYPDAMVGCGRRPADDARHLADPCLAVEVLSPGTARTDLHEKRDAYREVPSLAAYLAVQYEYRGVHRHWRDDHGAWHVELIAGARGDVPLPCPAGGAPLTLDEIYEDTDVPRDPPRPRLRRLRETAPAYGAP